MTDSDAGRPKAGLDVPEVIGLRLFSPSPEGFVPIEADDRELLVYGYPPRPDVGFHADLHDHWKQMMSRPMSLIQPQFAVLPDWLRARREGQPALDAGVLGTAGDGWSGSAAVPKAGDAFTFVVGQWTVPHVIAPAADEAISGFANWVGIDGYNRATTGLGDIVQAGTTQMTVTWPWPTGVSQHTFAWFEWWDDDPVTLANLPVSPGDVVYCAICIHSPTEAGVYIGNLTTRVLTSFVKTATGNHHVVGGSAEWILENPRTGWLGPLARFGPVYFDFCLAGTRNHTLHSPGISDRIIMDNTQGQRIATPDVVTGNLMRITYTAP